MLIARWQIDARFGHKQTAIELLRRWERDIGRQAGTGRMDFRILTGSVGARESLIEANHTVESLAQLESFFAAIGGIDAHQQWGKEIEPYVVSGSPAWTVYRTV
jgi:hypothetical protein